MKLAWLLIFVAGLQVCAGGKILAMAPMPSRSHHNLFEGLLTELAERGHEVTYISAFKSKTSKNFKQILLTDVRKEMMSQLRPGQENAANLFERRKMPFWATVLIMSNMGSKLMNLTLALPEMQNLINSDEKFDLIFGEIFLDESMLAGFSHKFNAPIVGLAPFMPNLWSNYMVGNPAPAAYIPDTLLGYTNKMTFMERVYNTLFTLVEEMYHRMVYIPGQGEIMKRYFGEDLPPIDEIIKNTSLILVNHHYSLAFTRPYLPNMVEIGGFHVNPPKPLPDNLKKYMDESKNGVLLFSMGSNLKSADIPEDMKQNILKAFSRLKQNVIWKFEDETLTNVPKNVKIEKWLPQSDILAHPNLRLFITHGGLLSTTEAVHRGVPVVGIPIFGDQPTNMKYTTNAGLGVTLEYDSIDEENFYNAITEVLNNPKYKENVKSASALLRDTLSPAKESAIYWIEYVLRHKGAPHLRSAAQDLAWYQLYLLDVYAIFFIIVIGSTLFNIYVFRFIVKRIKNKFCKKNKISSDKKTN